MTIDRGLPTPVYEQIAAVLRQRIEDGTYPPGRALPSAPALCQEFGVARLTMTSALRVLARAGLVYTEPRRGTYVTDRPPPPAPPRHRSFWRRRRGLVTAFAVLWLLTLASAGVLDRTDLLIGGDPTPFSQAQLDSARAAGCPAPQAHHDPPTVAVLLARP
jgi:GntR family transcriptional regulator